jgi:hypothetical protein
MVLLAAMAALVVLLMWQGSWLNPGEEPQCANARMDSTPFTEPLGPRLPPVEEASVTRAERTAVDSAARAGGGSQPLYGGLTEGYVAWLSGDLRKSTNAAWEAVAEAQDAAERSGSLQEFADVYERLSEHVLAAAVERQFVAGEYEVVPPNSPNPAPSSSPHEGGSQSIVWRRGGLLDFEDGRHRAEIRVVLDSSARTEMRSLSEQRDRCTHEVALQVADAWNRLSYDERARLMGQHEAARVSAKELTKKFEAGEIDPTEFPVRMRAIREQSIDVRIRVDRTTLLAKPRRGR